MADPSPFDGYLNSQNAKGAGMPPPGVAAPNAPHDPNDTPGYRAALTYAEQAPAVKNPDALDQFTDAMVAGEAPDVAGLMANITTHFQQVTGGKTPWTPEEMQRAVAYTSRQALKTYAEKHPWISGAAELAGSLAMPGLDELNAFAKARGVPGAVRALGIGGALGGVEAFGHAEGTPKERARAIVPGVLTGAGGALLLHGGGLLAGKVAPHLAAGASHIAKPLVSAAKHAMMPAEEREAAGLATGKKLGTEAVRSMVKRRPNVDLTASDAEAHGKDVTSAEHLGPHATKRLGNIAKAEGTTADELVPRIEARNEDTGRRVASHIAEVAGVSHETIEGDFEAANKKLREKAGPLYDAWHAQTDVESPELERVRQTPAFADALNVAARKAGNEHQDAVALGLADHDFPLEGKDPETKERITLRQPNGEPYRVPRETALSHAKAQGIEHSMANVDPEKKLPTALGYDYAKRAMDDLINSPKGKDPETGKLTAYGREIEQVRKELLDALTDEHKPWGKAAKAAFAAGGDPLEREEAFRTGSDIMSNGVTEGQFSKRIARYNPAQLEALKAGVANYARNLARAGKTKLGDLLTDSAKAKLRTIFGDEGGEKIIHDLELERGMSRSGKTLTPSPTIGPEGSDDISRITGAPYHFMAATENFSRGRWGSFVYHLFRGLHDSGDKYLNTPEGKAMRDRVGELLSMPPSKLDAELKAEGETPEQVSRMTKVLGEIKASPIWKEISETGAGRIAGATAGNMAAGNANYSRESNQPAPAIGDGPNAFDSYLKGQSDKTQSPPTGKQASPQGGTLTPANTGGTGGIYDAIGTQEWAGTGPAPTSVDGAQGPAQMKPETARQLGLDPSRLNDPAYAQFAKKTYIDHISALPNVRGDAARIAVGYFSGEGNIAPPGSRTPFLHDRPDGNGKMVSSYVADVLKRMGLPVPFQVAENRRVSLRSGPLASTGPLEGSGDAPSMPSQSFSLTDPSSAPAEGARPF